MKHRISAALQILPYTENKKLSYELIDKAIGIIAESGLNYEVTAFETDVEGSYEGIMALTEKIHKELYAAGAKDILLYIKLLSSSDKDQSFASKTDKFRK